MNFRIHTVEMYRHDLEADRVLKDEEHVYLDRRVEDGWQEVARFSLDDVAEVRQRAVDVDGRWFWRRCRLDVTADRTASLTEGAS